MRYLLPVLILLSQFSYIYAQSPSEYIITVSNDTIKGKVSYEAANLIRFKVLGQTKNKSYKPFDIKGYYNEGSLKLSKIDKTIGHPIFAYHYHMKEDSAAFLKATGMIVPQKGKINLYYRLPSTGGVVPSGIGYSNSRIPGLIMYEITDSNVIYSSDVYSLTIQIWSKKEAVNILAKLVEDNADLYEEVINMKGKFNITFVSNIIQKYNNAYTQNHSVDSSIESDSSE